MQRKFLDLTDTFKGHTFHFILWPQQWLSFHCDYTLKWKKFRFDESQYNNIPNMPGIYCFLVQPRIASNLNVSYLLYIGKSSRTLRKRFREYINEMKSESGRPKVINFLNRYKGFIYFYCTTFSDTDILSSIEERLIEAFIPPMNDQFPSTISRIIRAFS